MESVFTSSEITWETATVRLLASFILSTIIGLERQAHNQPAGLRTHILICLGATLVMLISIYIPQTFNMMQNGDPGRIAAQVVSGIGFLGAGAIMRFGGNVRGLTTAASIWAIAAVGLAIGAGMFIISLIGVILIFFVLDVMDFIENKFMHDKILKKIELVIKKKHLDWEALKSSIESLKIRVRTSGFESNASESNIRVVMLAFIPENFNLQLLSDCIEKIDGVMAISVESVN